MPEIFDPNSSKTRETIEVGRFQPSQEFVRNSRETMADLETSFSTFILVGSVVNSAWYPNSPRFANKNDLPNIDLFLYTKVEISDNLRDNFYIIFTSQDINRSTVYDKDERAPFFIMVHKRTGQTVHCFYLERPFAKEDTMIPLLGKQYQTRSKADQALKNLRDILTLRAGEHLAKNSSYSLWATYLLDLIDSRELMFLPELWQAERKLLNLMLNNEETNFFKILNSQDISSLPNYFNCLRLILKNCPDNYKTPVSVGLLKYNSAWPIVRGKIRATPEDIAAARVLKARKTEK